MIAALQSVPAVVLLLIATVLEAGGDAVLRLALFNHTGPVRFAVFALGAVLLIAYGTFINSAPIDFARVVGFYVALLFVVWQVITFVVFRTAPTAPILLGGALIVAGGLIATFWKTA